MYMKSNKIVRLINLKNDRSIEALWYNLLHDCYDEESIGKLFVIDEELDKEINKANLQIEKVICFFCKKIYLL